MTTRPLRPPPPSRDTCARERDVLSRVLTRRKGKRQEGGGGDGDGDGSGDGGDGGGWIKEKNEREERVAAAVRRRVSK